MEFRFRYLGSEGNEVEVSSLEQLRGLVQDGTVEEATLLYDALTREWAPARAHAVYRFIRDEAARPVGDGAPSAAPRAVAGGDDLGLGMTLSLEEIPNAPDADEAVRELLRERAEERAPAVRNESSLLSWNAPAKSADRAGTTPPAAASLAGPASAGSAPPLAAATSPAPQPAEPVAASRPAPFEFASPIPKIAHHPPQPVEAPVFRTVAPETEAAPLSIEAAAGSVTAWLDEVGRALIRSVGPRALPRTLVLAGLVGLALMLISTARKNDGVSAQATEQQAAMSVAPDVGRIVNRFASAEQSGFQSMVSGVDSLRELHDIAAVPPIWLEGRYLADAQRYPEVKEFWMRYGSFLRDVQASDTALFRAGFVRSLEEQGIGGAVLSLRLTQAMREFEKSQPRRDDVYRHMHELSAAALDLHALLVDRADDITYEPAIQKGRVSREPVVEAVAEDTVLKNQMWTKLELIFASLEWMGGDVGGSRDNLTDRLLEGIQAANAR